jgi:hypothetical protein
VTASSAGFAKKEMTGVQARQRLNAARDRLVTPRQELTGGWLIHGGKNQFNGNTAYLIAPGVHVLVDEVLKNACARLENATSKGLSTFAMEHEAEGELWVDLVDTETSSKRGRLRISNRSLQIAQDSDRFEWEGGPEDAAVTASVAHDLRSGSTELERQEGLSGGNSIAVTSNDLNLHSGYRWAPPDYAASQPSHRAFLRKSMTPLVGELAERATARGNLNVGEVTLSEELQGSNARGLRRLTSGTDQVRPEDEAAAAMLRDRRNSELWLWR